MSDTSWLSLSAEGFSSNPAVFSFELKEGVYGDDLLTAVVLSDGSLPSGIVGGAASFSFEFGGKKEHFNGVIASCLSSRSVAGTLTATLKIKTMLHLMDKEKKHAVYCSSDIEEICHSILGGSGIANAKFSLNSFYKSDYKVQYGESDMAFLQRLLGNSGIIEFVRHSEGNSELVIKDGDDFDVCDMAFSDCSLENTEGGNVVYGFGHVPSRLGAAFDAFGETFVVCSAVHKGSQAAAFGIKDREEGYACQVTAFSKRMLGSLPGRRAKPQVPGVIVATVEGFRNAAAALDSQGRYIVRLPFDDKNPEMASSIPVHLAQSFAGEGYGVHFPLRRGTPVLLAFEDGDIDKPIALGTLPSGLCAGPANRDKSFQNILRTIGGMELVLDDEAKSIGAKAPEKISAEADSLVLDGRKQSVLKSGGKVNISLDGSSGALEMEASGDIVLKAGGKIIFKASGVEEN